MLLPLCGCQIRYSTVTWRDVTSMCLSCTDAHLSSSVDQWPLYTSMRRCVTDCKLQLQDLCAAPASWL